MYYSESMIQMVEDLQRQASEMEKEVKDMMELEGRAIGIELDKRKNARELYNELMEHSNSVSESQQMTWAYVPCDMAETDPNCYPADSFDHSYLEEAQHDVVDPVVEEPEVHEEHHDEPVEPQPAEPVLDADGFVVEEEPAPEAPIQSDDNPPVV